jgi:hypothetical protein
MRVAAPELSHADQGEKFMLALTDEQVKLVQTAAAPLPYRCRDAFLQKLATQIDGRDIGDGELHRIAHAIAQELLTALHRPPRRGQPARETTEIRGFGITP